MAKEVAGQIKLQIKGGAANPSPPVGPALGSWNYVAPWQNNKMIGCFETFHVTLIDRDIGELSVPVEYEPGLALAGCDFSNIRANDSVKELIKNTGGVI